ncbi:MAG: undecaprenyldiphospho-muramoylpentapeptide beta-N-acetylglucosaminyltransferase [Polymorphobacter sp.]|uniref:undecaprenyldiphospho-muramoylpentapeptide beta-N-acetylglucosaminyltransferase n=1 Tax=Polymorphobacter sp. TaxID=1909290 RepID=UPI003A871C78
MSGPFVLAAGGTGGHMVPAHVLACELMARGHEVHLVTDARGLRFPGLFEGVPRTVVESGSVARSGLLALPKVALAVLRGWAAARTLFREIRPRAVIGFGGYPALPGLLAAVSMRLPSLIHEQNAVLGRVNRLLAPRVRAIATSYPAVRGLDARLAARVRLTGNPVRAEVVAARDTLFDAHASRLRLLVTGGSQGAAVLNSVVPAAVALLPARVRARLDVVHQGRDEDAEAMKLAYAEAGVSAVIRAYFEDLPREIAAAHLVVARAGASTVAELTVAGRPAVLVPLPIAADDHQADNARAMAGAGGAVMVRQGEFTPARLADILTAWLGDPDALAAAAEAARALGRPDAASALADLVTETAE